MSKKLSQNEQLKEMQKHIKPLNMNGLHGRMLVLPRPNKDAKRDILLIYGHHASVERVYGIAEAFNEYGAVICPDLPGFGGMDSFYKLGMKPTLDTMADYLAAFVKLKYKRKKITIAGMSLGFVIVTRMLQRYPELTSRVDLLISLVGFTHKYDLKLSPIRVNSYKLGAAFFSRRLPAVFFYNVVLHPSLIKVAYGGTYNAKKKLSSLSDTDRRAALNFEVQLWRQDDTRTYMRMAIAMFTLDNCKQQINLPVHHITVDSDQYFDSNTVEQHMRVVFNDYTEHISKLPAHMPSVIASKKDAAPFIPRSIRKVLSS